MSTSNSEANKMGDSMYTRIQSVSSGSGPPDVEAGVGVGQSSTRNEAIVIFYKIVMDDLARGRRF